MTYNNIRTDVSSKYTFWRYIMNILLDENLRKLRTSRGNRQEDLAAHLGVSVQSVSKWERGENLPDLTLVLD